MNMRNLACAGVAALALTVALLPVRANAGSATGHLTVTATVSSSCTIADAALGFGSYTPGNHQSGSTSFNVTCTLDAPFGVAMNAGSNGSGSGASVTRKMSNGTTYLNYQLYTNAAETTVWGTTCGSTAPYTNCVGGNGTGAPVALTVYGAIPATGNGATAVGAGSYTDTVTMTINF